MHKQKFRFYVLAAVVLVLLVLISACSGGNDNSSSTSPSAPSPSSSGSGNSGSGNNGGGSTDGDSTWLTDESKTFRWFISERRDAPIQQDWPILQEIFNQTNVKVEFEVVPENGLVERQQIMIATNSVTDFMPVNHSDARLYGPDGVFLNINDYLHLMPNLSAVFERFPNAKAMVTANDGGIYSIPNVDPEDFNFVWIVRKDLMEEYGIDNPTNPDEFYNMLKVMKEHNPDSYPLIPERNVFDGPATLVTAMIKMFTGLEGYIPYDPYAEEYKFAPDHPGFRDMLEYMHKLNAEGLLDPEFAIITSAQWDERMLSGKSFVTWYWKTRVKNKNTTAQNAGLIPGYEVAAIPMFGADGVPVYQFSRDRHMNHGIGISSKVHDPELAVRFLDYLVGPGSIITALGLEGVTYEIVDGEYKYLMDEIGSLNNARTEHGVIYNRFNQNTEISFHAQTFDEGETAIQEMYEQFVVPAPPPMILSDEENERYSDLISTVTPFMDEKIAEFISGRTPIIFVCIL